MNAIDHILCAERKIQRELRWNLLFETAEEADLCNSGEVMMEDIDELVLNRSSVRKNKSVSKKNISFSTGTRIKKLHRSNIKRKMDTKRLCLKKFILDDLGKSIIEHDIYFTVDDLEHTIRNEDSICSTKSLDQVTRYIQGFPYRMNINYTYPHFNYNMKFAKGYENSDKIPKRENDEEPQNKKRQRKIISELIVSLTQNLNNSKVNSANSTDYLDICTNKIDNFEINVSDVASINPRSLGYNLYAHDLFHLSLNKTHGQKTRNVKEDSLDTTHTAALSEAAKDKNFYDSGVTVDIGNQKCELNSVNNSRNQMKDIRSPCPILLQNLGHHKDAIHVNSITLDQNETLKIMMNKGVSSDLKKFMDEGIRPVNYKENPFLDPDEVPTALCSSETTRKENKAVTTSDSNQTPTTPVTKSKKRRSTRNFCKEITSSNRSSPSESPTELNSAKNVIEEDEPDTILDYSDGNVNSNKITSIRGTRSKSKRRNVETEVVTIPDYKNGFLDSNETARTSRARSKNNAKAVGIDGKDSVSSCEENHLLDSDKARAPLRSGNVAPAPITTANKYKNKKIAKSSNEMLSSNCKQNRLLDSNQIPMSTKEAETVTKKDTASVYKDELIDSRSAPVTRASKHKNINSSKEIISLNCKENQFLDPKEIRAASSGANIVIKQDKVITAAKDELVNSNPVPKKFSKKSKNTKTVKNSSKETLSLNCKETRFLDANEIHAPTCGTNIVIKVDKGTTTSDDKDELPYSNPARITRGTNYKNTKESSSLNCKGNQLLDSNEIGAALSGANIVIKVDKFSSTSDYSDELCHSNPPSTARARKCKNTKVVRDSSEEILSLNRRENRFLDSNKIHAASGEANIMAKVDQVTTILDYGDELFYSNPPSTARARKCKNTKAVRNSSEEILSLNRRENQFLDSNEIRAASGVANIVIKEGKVTTASDYQDEHLRSNSAPIKPIKKSKNTRTVKNNSREIVSLNCKENQFVDSNEMCASEENKVSTGSDYEGEFLHSNRASKKSTKRSKNAKIVKNSSEEILSSNRIENHLLDPNKNLVALTSAKAVTKRGKAAVTSDYSEKKSGVKARAKSKTRNPGRTSTEEEVIFPNCKHNPFQLDSEEIPAILTGAKTTVKEVKVTTTPDDKNGNLVLRKSVKSNNVKAGRTSRKDPVSSNVENHSLVSKKSTATATMVKTVIKDHQTSTTSYSDSALDANKTRIASITKLKTNEVIKSNGSLNSKEMKSINTEISSSSNNTEIISSSDDILQGDIPTNSNRINKTRDLIESFARDLSFKEANSTSDVGNADHESCLSSSDEKYISRYLKETNQLCEHDDLLRIVNFVERRSPRITNYILAMRVLEVLGRSGSDRYGSLEKGVKQGISTLSKSLGRRSFETYLAYALWLYERKRKT